MNCHHKMFTAETCSVCMFFQPAMLVIHSLILHRSITHLFPWESTGEFQLHIHVKSTELWYSLQGWDIFLELALNLTFSASTKGYNVNAFALQDYGPILSKYNKKDQGTWFFMKGLVMISGWICPWKWKMERYPYTSLMGRGDNPCTTRDEVLWLANTL